MPQRERKLDMTIDKDKQAYYNAHPSNRRIRMMNKVWVYSVMEDAIIINTRADDNELLSKG